MVRSTGHTFFCYIMYIFKYVWVQMILLVLYLDVTRSNYTICIKQTIIIKININFLSNVFPFYKPLKTGNGNGNLKIKKIKRKLEKIEFTAEKEKKVIFSSLNFSFPFQTYLLQFAPYCFSEN